MIIKSEPSRAVNSRRETTGTKRNRLNCRKTPDMRDDKLSTHYINHLNIKKEERNSTQHLIEPQDNKNLTRKKIFTNKPESTVTKQLPLKSSYRAMISMNPLIQQRSIKLLPMEPRKHLIKIEKENKKTTKCWEHKPEPTDGSSKEIEARRRTR